MPNFVLLTPKHLMESSVENWVLAIQEPAILFTGIEAKKYIEANKKIFNVIFENIFYFENYLDSDLIDKEILSLGKNKIIHKIIALSEVDILRAARIREKLGIEGQHIESAMAFRDKYKMKQLAEKAGVLTPKYCKVNNTIDLMQFIDQNKYPVVIKPIAGRGSSSTFIVKNATELDKYLAQGIFSKFDCTTYLLVEEFIAGDIYHVDGHILNNELSFISASRYINNCLNFVYGASLGSITLSDSNSLNSRLIKNAKQILFDAFSAPRDTLFHIEFFVADNLDIYLCEAASRLGGGNINEQLSLAYGYDLKIKFIQSYFSENIACFSGKQKTVASRLLIPPRTRNILKKIPESCPFDFVKSYRQNGIINKLYYDITMSNQEIAHFLFTATTEDEALHNMKQLNNWFNHETEWESLDDEIRKITT
ncbi:MAG: ATP-dependent carboxylate-amine ligase protein [uncultured bacterium]|nr:MAG: ATP-dependent carboxylate-amine ligase protein [uncultured bacterium]OGT26082.1 MAG: hypothetical protein A3B71_04280 [Gammaproteobacteria bacterium RIFCSPHIGHO2_02_FULL_42_43]OGT50896.1 MAG: hypothetical protein A3E54_03950 [Gammaproteobacteria bacterium RIFCSPHIGHO2_12_FULL_41_25]OGT62824.1 MAG: hypothetical protein A3I77_00175 [Gammaproteobacteria bacterium RIFCSPLOWO2_02_FULL_42_14]OGT86782.1 MAG: hypothetical protein A3G86_03060 [Gammaproteobacteria bacterium RIFCSPLOWO2_12_FULL_42